MALILAFLKRFSIGGAEELKFSDCCDLGQVYYQRAKSSTIYPINIRCNVFKEQVNRAKIGCS